MRSFAVQYIWRIALLPVVVWLILFLPAGTTDYWEVYGYFAITIVFSLYSSIYFMQHDRELLERRLRTREPESMQKVVVALISVVIVAIYLVAGFDKRFGWSSVPIVVELFGFVLVVVGYCIIFQVLKSNSFAARTVAVEENHKLVDKGPYALVRHPMYSGFVIIFLGTPLALGSWWGLTALVPILLGLGFRILNEEDILRRDLDGYTEYCQHTRWRLLPGIW